ncbi:hypothetical protein ABPG77_011022 [Micractinium sp. CCAP 211/92]
MAANEDPPGQEFLLRRLQRAAAVPLGEHSREVAAFIAAMQLEDQVPSLLPPTSGGEPALQQASLSTQRRVLLAHLMWVNVIHACPVRSVSVSTKARLHLQQYASELDALAAAHSSDTAGREGSGSAADSGGSGRESSSHTSDTGNGADSPGAEPSSGEVSLAKVLAMLSQAHGTAAGNDLFAAFLAVNRAHTLLKASLPAVEGCLLQLAGLQRELLPESDPLPTVQQLLCLCVCLMAMFVEETDRRCAELDPDAQHRAQALLPALEQAASEALQLEPHSPKLQCLLGQAAVHAGRPQRALDHFLACSDLAQQQGSEFFTVAGAELAVQLAARHLPSCRAPSERCPVSLSSMQAALDAFLPAEPALQRCKRLLPQPWLVDPIPELPLAAAGVGEAGLGRRRDCQVAHWPVHRANCHPPTI